MKRKKFVDEKRFKKKRWICEILTTLFEIALFSVIFYCMYRSVTYRVTPRDELISVTGTVAGYERIYNIRNTSVVTNEYRIYLNDGETYYIESPSLTAFRKSDFEFYVHKGDTVTLMLDPNEHTGFRISIAEIWCEGSCFMAYEDYKKENEKNTGQLRVFNIFYIILYWGCCIAINIKIWKNMRKDYKRYLKYWSKYDKT